MSRLFEQSEKTRFYSPYSYCPYIPLSWPLFHAPISSTPIPAYTAQELEFQQAKVPSACMCSCEGKDVAVRDVAVRDVAVRDV